MVSPSKWFIGPLVAVVVVVVVVVIVVVVVAVVVVAVAVAVAVVFLLTTWVKTNAVHKSYHGPTCICTSEVKNLSTPSDA